MLLGDSKGFKYDPFVVFKVKPSTVQERRDENESIRHGFSNGMWRKSIVPAQRECNMQLFANGKGNLINVLLWACRNDTNKKLL
jgi:hypothetical protein